MSGARSVGAGLRSERPRDRPAAVLAVLQRPDRQASLASGGLLRPPRGRFRAGPDAAAPRALSGQDSGGRRPHGSRTSGYSALPSPDRSVGHRAALHFAPVSFSSWVHRQWKALVDPRRPCRRCGTQHVYFRSTPPAPLFVTHQLGEVYFVASPCGCATQQRWWQRRSREHNVPANATITLSNASH